jgi:hypothetical protein
MQYLFWVGVGLLTLTLDELHPFVQMVVMIATGEKVTDIPEMGTLLLSVMGSSTSMAETYT